MLPPAFLAQLGQRAQPARATGAPPPPSRPRAVSARPPTRGLRWPIGRLAAWTVAWMVFEWWAVIGWPDALERSPAALMLGGVATLVGLVVWRDVREPAPPTDFPPVGGARVIPLRRLRPSGVAAPVEEAWDPELKEAA